MGYKTPNIDRLAKEGMSFTVDQALSIIAEAGTGRH
jgi:arylsulfatase A-like enzyme